MHRVLLGLAATVAISLPASVQAQFVGNGIPDAKSSVGNLPPSFAQPVDRGFNRCSARGDFRRNRGDRHDQRGRDFSGCDTVVLDWYGGEWARYNNRSWEPGSYNDWWHDRPDRAFPRWMSRNQDCARPWYSGDVLTC